MCLNFVYYMGIIIICRYNEKIMNYKYCCGKGVWNENRWKGVWYENAKKTIKSPQIVTFFTINDIAFNLLDISIHLHKEIFLF